MRRGVERRRASATTPGQSGFFNQRGVSSVEFSIVAGLALILIFAIVEFGRFIATYSAIETASREAARYGSAVGESANGIPRYTDCTEIRNAGRRLARIVSLSDADIGVTYDAGPGTSQTASCPAGGTIPPSAVSSQHRIVVSVATTYRSTVPVIGSFLDGTVIRSTDRRTIFKAS